MDKAVTVLCDHRGRKHKNTIFGSVWNRLLNERGRMHVIKRHFGVPAQQSFNRLLLLAPV